jgi:hypothetical protein
MSEYALYIGPEGLMGFKLLQTEIIHQHRASTYNTSVVQKKKRAST